MASSMTLLADDMTAAPAAAGRPAQRVGDDHIGGRRSAMTSAARCKRGAAPARAALRQRWRRDRNVSRPALDCGSPVGLSASATLTFMAWPEREMSSLRASQSVLQHQQVAHRADVFPRRPG
jgi:hypothetical protein